MLYGYGQTLPLMIGVIGGLCERCAYGRVMYSEKVVQEMPYLWHTASPLSADSDTLGGGDGKVGLIRGTYNYIVARL